MAGSRTLKLSILADVDNLRKGLNGAEKDVQGFGDKISNFGKVAGAAFLAAGAAAAAYAGKLAIDGVKAAIEDEAAQLKLATSLRNVTGATEAQIKATENYILKTSLAFGVTDQQLRPSLDRLVRSTQDVQKAQELQTLALNIAAGTGKDLTTVSEALGKAYDGNFGALRRLGVSIDDSIIKSKDFDAATAVLANTFKDQASIQANTFDGKIRRLSVAFDEGKETVGAYILDAVTPLLEIVVQKIIPNLSKFAGEIRDNLGPALNTIIGIIKAVAIPVFQGLQYIFKQVQSAISDNSDELNSFKTFAQSVFNFVKTYLAPIFGSTLKLALMAVGQVVGNLVRLFANLFDKINDAFNAAKTFVNFVAKNPVVQGITGLVDNVFGGGRAAGGPVSGGTTYLVGENGPELFTPSSSGNIIPNNRLGGGGGTINITVNGAIDAEGTARQIVDILNRATARGGSGSGALVYP
jgi:hypothetical protein